MFKDRRDIPYRTDRDGAVKVTETPEGLFVKTCRDFALKPTRNVGGELRNIKRLFATWWEKW